MSTVTIVARIEARTGQVDLVKSELGKLVAPTLQEAGCIQNDLHQDNQNPAVFFFYENWESRPLWQQHYEECPHRGLYAGHRSCR